MTREDKPTKPKPRLKSALYGTVQQFLLLAVLIFGVSWINNYSEMLLQSLIGSTAARWLFASIGTPVHEFSHALVALLFGYQITEFRPFIPDPTSPVLGYVRYTYDPHNLIQQAGHFFVGIAPLLLPIAVIYLLYRFLLPQDIIAEGRLRLKRLFHPRSLLFVFCAAQIILHMRCSLADLQGALIGLPILILLHLLLGFIFPRGQRYLLRASITATALAFAFAAIDFVLIRGILLLLG